MRPTCSAAWPARRSGSRGAEEPSSCACALEPSSRACALEPSSRACALEPSSRACALEPSSRACALQGPTFGRPGGRVPLGAPTHPGGQALGDQLAQQLIGLLGVQLAGKALPAAQHHRLAPGIFEPITQRLCALGL